LRSNPNDHSIHLPLMTSKVHWGLSWFPWDVNTLMV
jgi:hypothetical protein